MVEIMKIDIIAYAAFLGIFALGACTIAAFSAVEKTESPKKIPISEIRCSDLERVYEECESAPDVAICRGRYTIKIANCFGG